MRIAREGYPLILTAAVLSIAAFLAGWKAIGIAFVIVTLAIIGFFRDPDRRIPAGENLILAPADGRVVSIANVQGDGLFPEAKIRVSIFLSPLDVHINRTPVAGKVEDVRYQRGKFIAAYKDEASERNEQNAIKMVDERHRAIGVVQVAGVLARRIVCHAKRGDTVARGERFGMIMFGSRTDTYLPAGCKVEVAEGERVKGGETILGRFV